MILKIGFTGTHCTGKTSVAREFAKRYAMTLVTSASRRVNEIGYGINDEATCESQAATSMARLADQVSAGDRFISDRTLLDSMAYNKWQLDNVWPEGEQTQFWYDTMDTITRKQMRFYDYLIYVPITFPIVSDGVRAEDNAYQRDIDQLVLEFLGEYQLSYYYMPAGTVEERVDWLARLTNPAPDPYTLTLGF